MLHKTALTLLKGVGFVLCDASSLCCANCWCSSASPRANTHKCFHFKYSEELFTWPPCCQTLCLLTFIKTQLNWISALQTHPCTHTSLHPEAATYTSTIYTHTHTQTEHYTQMHTTACSTCTHIAAVRFSSCSGTVSAPRRSLSESEGRQGAACG